MFVIDFLDQIRSFLLSIDPQVLIITCIMTGLVLILIPIETNMPAI